MFDLVTEFVDQLRNWPRMVQNFLQLGRRLKNWNSSSTFEKKSKFLEKFCKQYEKNIRALFSAFQGSKKKKKEINHWKV